MPMPSPERIASVMASPTLTWNGEAPMETISWPLGPSNSQRSSGTTGLTRRRQSWLASSEGSLGVPFRRRYSGEAQRML